MYRISRGQYCTTNGSLLPVGKVPVRSRRRRTARLTDYKLTVNLGPELGRRIEATAIQHDVSIAMVARYAIEAGFLAAVRRLDREAPPEDTTEPAAAAE